MPADVSVVIGNHQGADVLDDCLRSLAEQTCVPSEVIVVDGGSTDASPDIAARHGARWIAEANRGLSSLYNRGAEAAASDYVLFANNDIALDSRCIELLRRPLANDPSLFAADPRQLDWEGSRILHGRTTLCRGRLLHELVPGFHLDQTADADSVVPTVMANGGCMLVRRSTLLELGGFDETFFMDFEDLDVCWRAWSYGAGSVHVPDALLRHRVGGVTTRAVLPRRLASSHHNLLRWAIKCLPARDAATVLAVELLRLLRHPIVVGRGLAAFLPELREVLAERRAIQNRKSVLESLLALRRDEMQS